jgi:hypothetical protein
MAGDSTGNSKNAERLGQIGELIQSIAKPLGAFLTTAIPLVITYCNKAAEFYGTLPQNFIHFLIGLFFCFFGGIYPTLFAAIQAVRQVHGEKKRWIFYSNSGVSFLHAFLFFLSM